MTDGLRFLPYLPVAGYGAVPANGIVVEKANRVIEVLRAAVPPWARIVGKLAGVGLAGRTQRLLWARRGRPAAPRPQALTGPAFLLLHSSQRNPAALRKPCPPPSAPGRVAGAGDREAGDDGEEYGPRPGQREAPAGCKAPSGRAGPEVAPELPRRTRLRADGKGRAGRVVGRAGGARERAVSASPAPRAASRPRAAQAAGVRRSGQPPRPWRRLVDAAPPASRR